MNNKQSLPGGHLLNFVFLLLVSLGIYQFIQIIQAFLG